MKKMLLLSGAAVCAAVLSGCCCCGCGGTTECVEEDVIIATPVQPKGKCKGGKKVPCNTGNCAVPTACNEAENSGKVTACNTCGCEEKKGDKSSCTGNLTASNCSGNQDQAPAPAPVPAAD